MIATFAHAQDLAGNPLLMRSFTESLRQRRHDPIPLIEPEIVPAGGRKLKP